MPNRILRDGILTSESVSALSWAEEVFYRRLMSVADDHGRFHAAPKLIRAACYPLLIDKVSDADIGKWLTSCVTAALVSVYPAPDGKRYLQITKFGQQVRSKSKFPDPVASEEQPKPAPASNCEQVPATAHLVVFGVGDGNSVPKGTDASAAPAVEEKQEGKAQLWQAAVAVLKAGGCESEPLARSFMGKLVKDYGLDAVRDAVASAATAQPADAREYLKATCQRLKGDRKDPVTVLESPMKAITEAMKAADAAHAEKLADPEEKARVAAAIEQARQRMAQRKAA